MNQRDIMIGHPHAPAIGSPRLWAESLDLVEICGGGDPIQAQAVLQHLAILSPETRVNYLERMLGGALGSLLPPPSSDPAAAAMRSELLREAREAILREIEQRSARLAKADPVGLAR